MTWTSEQIENAAAELLAQHDRGLRFEGLQGPVPLSDTATAYAIQQAFVARQCQRLGTRAAGYKIALTTPAMRELVGYADSISGRVLASQIYADGVTLQTRRHGRLAVEFEIAFVMRADLPRRYTPWGREIAEFVQRAHPALELVDDRRADYAALPHQILTLIADNAWNAGLVLGQALTGWDWQDLDQIEGVAQVEGRDVGRGWGSDVLGHPLDALAWLANHLQASGSGLREGDFVTTGSLVKTQFPLAPCEVALQLGSTGRVSARLV